jgi:hypothetical protein
MKIFLIGLLIGICAVAAEKTYTVVYSETASPIRVVKWASVTSGDTTEAYRINGKQILGFQVTGTRGTATASLKGSLNGTDYVFLRDAAGVISSDATQVHYPTSRPLFIQPTIATPNASTDVTIHVLIEK